MRKVPKTSCSQNTYVDLLVKSEVSGALLRIPNCFILGGEWYSIFYVHSFRKMRWHPVSWMPVPEIPIEDELPRVLSIEGDPV